MSLWLFVRAHRAHYLLAAIVAVGLVARAVGTSAVRFRLTDSLSVPWLMFVPVIDASLIGLCTASATRKWDQQTRRNLRPIVLTTLLTLLGASMAATSFAAGNLTGGYSAAAAVRNLVGFVGMALVGAVLVGALLAWVLPLLYATISVVGGEQGGNVQAWAWPALPDGHPGATGQALLWLVLGLWLASTFYLRQDAT